jgi:hypothetical protein
MSKQISNTNYMLDRSMSDFTNRQTYRKWSGEFPTRRMPPLKPIDFRKNEVHSRRLWNLINRYGLSVKTPTDMPYEFRNWSDFLRTCLRYWEEIPIRKCLTSFDILEGCLTQGPLFAEWLKKCRIYTMISVIGLGDNTPPDEYILEDWEGYDSIFPETNLIHWVEDIDDFPHCMMPIPRKIGHLVPVYIQMLKEKWAPDELNLSGVNQKFRFVKNSKVYSPSDNKSFYIKEAIDMVKEIRPGWYGKRSLVQALPGGGRDATVADPYTLVKIKMSNEIFTSIVTHHPNSAMTNYINLQTRMSRLWNCKTFLHLDFKKIGLTFPRNYFVQFGKAVEQVYGISMDWFDFDDLYIQDGDTTYRTKRGYALGWMNEVVTLVIIAFIKNFRHMCEIPFDFLVFNDDVEIGFNHSDIEMINVFKMSIIRYFESKEVFISIKKTFISNVSIFLENYYQSEEIYNFNKYSIACRLYAKARLTSYPGYGKQLLHDAIGMWENEDIIREVVFHTKNEYKKVSDLDVPFALGGYHVPWKHTLDDSLNETPSFVFFLKHLYLQKNISLTLAMRVMKEARESRDKKMSEAYERMEEGVPDPKELLHEESDDLFISRLAPLIDKYGVSFVNFNTPVDPNTWVQPVEDPGTDPPESTIESSSAKSYSEKSLY